VVANSETMKQARAEYGIPTIWTMIWTGFIPRAIWPNKPAVSGARGIGLLYFRYGESSPAITPMIDLLLNYGRFSIPIGMALLGMLLGFSYSALIETEIVSAWRIAGYYMLLSCINYEGFFGSILPLLIRAFFVFIIGTSLILTMTKTHNVRKRVQD